ncbi:ATP-dependent DNA helicase [Lactobacillus amylovorus]|uniref:ATP-dependent DNA helicase n=1 Tax=Lactobacillus amylovorus TaxID=1604 RepID=UPI00232F6989|nr:AAA family ATPase [Lactobacillus amylovorus]MDB6253107.1 AAA family ATPase [Lactobacillus amylovorus]
MELTTEQQKAKNLILNGTNVFLTGDAGTGKSYILKQVINTLPPDDTVVCAPTGVAAVNIHGITIHRLLELNPDKDIINLHPEHVPNKLEKAKTVIVDEISMCRSDLFIWLSETLKLAEIKFKHPIQLVVVGDFYQLPPVLATPAEKEYFANGKVYAFNTAEWKSWHFQPVVLHQVIRQTNAEFSKALNSIRKGNTKYIHYLNSKSTKNRINNAITLVSTNKEANAINLKKVSSLEGGCKIYNSQISGQINDQDKPTPDKIKLKVGALVVFTANASDNTYSNGTLATVTQLSADYIKVKIENSSEEITVFPFTWTIYDYRLIKEDNQRKLKKIQIGEYQQLPVKLGYAITIHKSQGQTYSAANIAPAGWLSGLLYVALSRVKDIKQLHLLHKIEPNMVNADPTVRNFYQHLEWLSKKNYDNSITMKIPMMLKKEIQEINNLNTAQIRKLQLFIRDLINTN